MVSQDLFRRVRDQLTRDEGDRSKPYVDTVGKITIGIGHNLTDLGISPAVRDLLFSDDLYNVLGRIGELIPWFGQLDEVRQGALINMAFNLGADGLLQFGTFLGFMRTGQYEAAATDLMTTKWAEEVGDRAERVAQQVRKGEWI